MPTEIGLTLATMAENTEITDKKSDTDTISDGGLSKEITEFNKEILSMENDEKCDEIPTNKMDEDSKTDTGSLLKQLDDALDEIDTSKEDPIQALLEEAKLLEDSSSVPENKDSDRATPVENDNQETEKDSILVHDASIEDFDDSDLKIIDEIDDQDEKIMVPELEEENENGLVDEKNTDSSEIEQKEIQKDVAEDKEVEAKTEEIPVANSNEQSKEETIVLESDEEEETSKIENEVTIIKRDLNSCKRTNIDDNPDEVEEPPNKRVRASPTSDDCPSEKELMVIEDTDAKNDKPDVEDEDLLVVSGGHRRRSESEIEINQIAKRTGSPIQDEASYDTLKRSKQSEDGSVDSSQDDTKMDDVKPEVSEESIVKENGEKAEETAVLKQDDAETKTEPLITQNIELTPNPEESTEAEEKHTPISVEFLKSFKKSFHLMSRSDLEDFVLQKVVETIINKSEVSELRQKSETQENTIANQRQRINDLAKQFRDLEMVHNRVTKDLETKSTGLVTPVKITRAVGLQVSQPRPKTDFRPMYAQPNQRVPPFPSRSPQRPNNQMGNINAIQTTQRINMSLRQSMPQNNSAGVQSQFGQTKTTAIRPIGQITQNVQAKMIGELYLCKVE